VRGDEGAGGGRVNDEKKRTVGEKRLIRSEELFMRRGRIHFVLKSLCVAWFGLRQLLISSFSCRHMLHPSYDLRSAHPPDTPHYLRLGRSCSTR
jgi:hypothetical protein